MRIRKLFEIDGYHIGIASDKTGPFLLPYRMDEEGPVFLTPEGVYRAMSRNVLPYRRWIKVREFVGNEKALIDCCAEAKDLLPVLERPEMSLSEKEFTRRCISLGVEAPEYDDDFYVECTQRFLPIARPADWQRLELVRCGFAGDAIVLSPFRQLVSDFCRSLKRSDAESFPPTTVALLAIRISDVLGCRALEILPRWPAATLDLIRDVAIECGFDEVAVETLELVGSEVSFHEVII